MIGLGHESVHGDAGKPSADRKTVVYRYNEQLKHHLYF